MNQEILEKLNAFCADFKSFRANTEDGQGKSLHDIKHTFDYVAQTVDTYHLTGTKFGANLSKKAKESSQVLSQLWLCLQDLEKSINTFTSNQSSNNNLATATAATPNPSGYDYNGNGNDNVNRIYPKPVPARVVANTTSPGAKPNNNLTRMTK